MFIPITPGMLNIEEKRACQLMEERRMSCVLDPHDARPRNISLHKQTEVEGFPLPFAPYEVCPRGRQACVRAPGLIIVGWLPMIFVAKPYLL